MTNDHPRRLAPAERRAQILDCAMELIVEVGVASCTVDAIAQRVGVTPQLVHKYFGNRLSLLSELFDREYAAYSRRLAARLAAVQDFEAIVRVFVEANFDQLSDRTAIGRLTRSAEVGSEMTSRVRDSEREAGVLLARVVSQEYPAPPDVLELVLRMGSAASIAAGNLSASPRRKRSRDADIEDAVRFIVAGVRSLMASHDP